MAFELEEFHVEAIWEDGTELAGLRATLSLDAPIQLMLDMQQYGSGVEIASLRVAKSRRALEQAKAENRETCEDRLLDDLQALEAARARDNDRLRTFGDELLISWNMRFRGQDVPATGDGVLSLPPRVQSALLAKWGEIVRAQGPFERSSADGRPSAEPSTEQLAKLSVLPSSS